MNHKTLYKILVAILPFAILVLARFWQTRANCGPKIIIHCHPLIQTAKIIINYHVEFELAQTT